MSKKWKWHKHMKTVKCHFIQMHDDDLRVSERSDDKSFWHFFNSYYDCVRAPTNSVMCDSYGLQWGQSYIRWRKEVQICRMAEGMDGGSTLEPSHPKLIICLSSCISQRDGTAEQLCRVKYKTEDFADLLLTDWPPRHTSVKLNCGTHIFNEKKKSGFTRL